jgi:hypothetical protein
MPSTSGVIHEEQTPTGPAHLTRCCEEKLHLQSAFLEAIAELNRILSDQTHAIACGDSDFSRFDLLLHTAQEKKDGAKYALMNHMEAHGCEEAPENVTHESRPGTYQR